MFDSNWNTPRRSALRSHLRRRLPLAAAARFKREQSTDFFIARPNPGVLEPGARGAMIAEPRITRRHRGFSPARLSMTGCGGKRDRTGCSSHGQSLGAITVPWKPLPVA